MCVFTDHKCVFLGGGSLGEGGFKYYEQSYRMYHLDCETNGVNYICQNSLTIIYTLKVHVQTTDMD